LKDKRKLEGENMENKIEVAIGHKKLIAYINDWQDGMPKEIFISIADDNDVVIQDICMVREHYHYNKNEGEFEIDDTLIDCKVWADSDSEDYTDEFCIGIYEED
jgi:hypothetical protein